MKIARYQIEGRILHGVLHDDGTLERLAGDPFTSLAVSGERDRLEAVRLLAPVERPRVFGAGLNYAAHAAESGQPVPPIPMLFMKPDSAVIGPEEPIVYPLEAGRVDYECELTVVIGKTARRVSEADALDHVFGYTCGNDVSQRPIQFAEMKLGTLLIGKAFDSFCPLGPVIVTDIDPGDLRIRTRLNGKTVQDSRTSDLIYSVPKLVSYLSQAITLRPGDVILTGTPAGIGPMLPGDVVEIDIEGIGELKNPVVAEAQSAQR
ncbi:MAG: fumarylacetoacetate hydrolase family protein [Burkholderiales bacterium]|nr:fumarylacetoacetate hydrolase family protein [Burkholderiales bacterium]